MQSAESTLPRIADLGGSAREVAILERARGADADEAAQQLEGLFATMLVREMRRAVPEGFFGEGSHAEVYEGWLDEHVGSALARDGALHLAGMIRTNLGMKRASAGENG
jgi:Rod binding domain-containing protein